MCPGSPESKPHPGYIEQSMARWSRQGIVPLYSALVQPHLKYCMQCWAPPFKNDVQVLECIQRRATELVTGLEGTSYGEQMRTLDLSRLERRRLRGNLIALCSCPRRGCGKGGAELFSLESSDRMPGNGSKLCPSGRFSLDTSKLIFLERVVKHWNRLP